MQSSLENPALPQRPPFTAAITFDSWFFAPDGQQYRTAFGLIQVLKAKDVLGLEPKNSANWFVQIGSGERAVLLAGCQVHSAMLCSTKPTGPHVYDASGPVEVSSSRGEA